MQNMGVIRMAEKSAIQRIKDLDAERASIFDQAKEEALEKAKAAFRSHCQTRPRRSFPWLPFPTSPVQLDWSVHSIWLDVET